MGTFLLVSVLAGLLVAGLAIPAAALAGVTSTTLFSSLTKLPEALETPPQAERTSILLADGSMLTQLYDENRVIVTLDQVAPIMKQAQVAIEDDRFYSHGALDLRSLAKAVLSNIGSSGGGGSTLTQQYVKQVLVEQAMQMPTEEERQAALADAQGRTIQRKVREMRYAIALEQQFSKDQILENYLNIAYYGDGAYGVEAAAHHYFNTTAADLTLAQAAMLAGIVQTPVRNPADPDERADSIARRDVVIDRMLELGLITKEDADAAKAEGFDPSLIQGMPNGCDGVTDVDYIQVCQFILNNLQSDAFPSLGSSKQDRLDTLRTGGYTITTTIDPTRQKAAQDAISSRIADADPVKSTVVEMQPGTGVIWAAAQNRRELGYSNDDLVNGKSSFQYFAPQSLGGDEGAQPGSTFKGFVVSAALDAGVPPSKQFDAKGRMDFSNDYFMSCNGPVKASKGWVVSNDSDSGVMDMYHGTANSVNTYFVQLEELIGICASATMAETLGAEVSDPTADEEHPNLLAYNVDPSFTLGVAYVSPLSMAVAYSTLAARGLRCDPVIIGSIQDRSGNQVPIPNGNCRQVIRQEVADGANAVLGNAFTYGTARGWGLGGGRTMSGKTGTTDNGSAAWLIGYAPNIVGVSMVAADTNGVWNDFWAPYIREGAKSMIGVKLPVSGTRLSGVGAADAGPIWRAAMSVAVDDLPVVSFTKPGSDILNGKRVVPPKTDGMSADDARKTLQAAGFFVTEKEVFDDQPAGSFVSVSCDYVYGGTCTMNISQGPRPPEPTPEAPATVKPQQPATSPPPTGLPTAHPTGGR
ncbi:MAG: penicillin-binding protein [Propionibacteriaceae bacterium]|nr:penicillin-binding protein [Propionibacteriaceae bacterium]